MTVNNLKSKIGSVYIPTLSDPYVKITITDDDGVVHTVLNSYSGSDADNYTLSASLTRPVTDKIGSFTITLANILGRYVNAFDGGEVVNIYSDMTDATTRIFRGKIDNPLYGFNLTDGFVLNIDGRDYPEIIDKTITTIEASVFGNISLAGILYNHFSDVTLTFWNGTEWAEATYDSDNDDVTWGVAVNNFPTTLVNLTAENKKGWNVITEVCNRIGVDCYMWYDGSKWTLRTFVSGDITNTNVNVAYGVNLVGLGDYGVDTTEVINRAVVYGKTESDNILLLKTENDADSQSNLWIKDSIINDGSLQSMGEVQDKVDYELSEGSEETPAGRTTTVMMPSLQPGDTINFSVPYCTISGAHRVYGFTHNISDSFTTSIDVSKKIKGVSDLFVPKANAEEFVSALNNPNGMTDSYTVYFDEVPSKMTHTNTVESDGKLRLSGTQTSGYAVASTVTTDQEVSECELRRYENFETADDVYYVSNTGGALWERYISSTGNTHTFDVPGDELTFKLALSRVSSVATSPVYESVSLLYR